MVLTYIKYYYLRDIIQRENLSHSGKSPLQSDLVKGWFFKSFRIPNFFPLLTLSSSKSWRKHVFLYYFGLEVTYVTSDHIPLVRTSHMAPLGYTEVKGMQPCLLRSATSKRTLYYVRKPCRLDGQPAICYREGAFQGQRKLYQYLMLFA